jgi:cytochrome c553
MRVDGPIPCAACHYFNGKGFLEIPDLAGLPKAYIIEQVQEFRSGRRRSYQKNRSGTGLMIGVAKRLTDSELDAAADYYSRLSRRPWFRIVETNSVPSTTATYFGWLEPAKDRGTEPIKGRIIELPENWDRSWVEDPHSGVIAYIAPGSAKRGEALVHASGNGFAECSSCHGSDLRGDGNVPSIAGRSPAYISRMLWDMKTGARSGPVVALMQPVVQRLTGPNITDIAAYLVSLQP